MHDYILKNKIISVASGDSEFTKEVNSGVTRSLREVGVNVVEYTVTGDELNVLDTSTIADWVEYMSLVENLFIKLTKEYELTSKNEPEPDTVFIITLINDSILELVDDLAFTTSLEEYGTFLRYRYALPITVFNIYEIIEPPHKSEDNYVGIRDLFLNSIETTRFEISPENGIDAIVQNIFDNTVSIKPPPIPAPQSFLKRVSSTITNMIFRFPQ